MRSPAQQVAFTVNGRRVEIHVDPVRRLADVLREDLGLTGTKVGCNAGDCGACTVRLDGRQVCACMVAAAQVQDRTVVTVEGLKNGAGASALQQAFLTHGAAQCGICTPGMLMAADDLLACNPAPTEAQVLDALGGVLCRCTGYRKIVEAVLSLREPTPAAKPAAGAAVGARLARVDGAAKIAGTERYGADEWPDDCLVLRAVRSPHPHARFTIGDLAALHAKHPGLLRVLTAKDIPGQNRYGIYPTGKDQPALAEGYVRYRGEAVAALVGDDASIANIRDSDLPLRWEPLPSLSLDGALVGARASAARRFARQHPGQGSGRARRCGCDIGDVGGHGGVRRRNHIRRTRLYRAGGRLCPSRRRPRGDLRDHADALHGPRRAGAHPGPEAGTSAHHPQRLRRRLRRQARSVAPAADCDGGLAAESARALRLYAPPNQWPPPPSAIPPA
jgi:aerobic-type carbon monoxide dehydrogenase small subunit (CoxS/CutS family)